MAGLVRTEEDDDSSHIFRLGYPPEDCALFGPFQNFRWEFAQRFGADEAWSHSIDVDVGCPELTAVDLVNPMRAALLVA